MIFQRGSLCADFRLGSVLPLHNASAPRWRWALGKTSTQATTPPLPGLPWSFTSRKSSPSQVPFLNHQWGTMAHSPITSATVNFPEAW